MKRFISAALLIFLTFPLYADESVPFDYPCGFLDYGNYIVNVSQGCRRFTYSVSCGGVFGNSASWSLISISPPCQNV